MEKLTRLRYTLEYKQEAVHLVSSGQRVAAAKALGIVEQTLANWVKADDKSGQLHGLSSEQLSKDALHTRLSQPR